MRKNLTELQEELRTRNLAQSVVVEEKRELCASCVAMGKKNPRLARRGSTVCSRCTYKGIQNQLRDTLPGMEVKKEVQTEFKATRNPNSTYLYAGVQEGMRAATHSPFDKVEANDKSQLPVEERVEEIDEIDEVKDSFQESSEVPQGSHYTRKQVSRMVGVSPTTICRWEAKGATPLPKRFAHNNQLIYTDEIVEAIRAYAHQTVDGFAAPSVAKSPQEIAAKGVTKKTFKINKRLERAVSLRINQTGFRGPGKLM